MRGRLHLANGAIVREIRPIDLKNAIAVLTKDGEVISDEIDGTQWHIALLANSDLIEGKMTEESINTFLAFNSNFFSPSGGDSYPRSLTDIADDLNNACAVLIHHGHLHCWDYGWSFFQTVQELYKE